MRPLIEQEETDDPTPDSVNPYSLPKPKLYTKRNKKLRRHNFRNNNNQNPKSISGSEQQYTNILKQTNSTGPLVSKHSNSVSYDQP